MEILFEELLGISRLQIMANPGLRLNESEMLRIHFAHKKLLEHMPVQHITGVAYFYGLRLKVDKNVLIPRPETEELADWILNSSALMPRLKVLDIGTGSGAIALALAKTKPNWDITAIDISETALEMAASNASLNNLQVKFQPCDILDKDTRSTLPDDYDLIVSNPPYVTESDKARMLPNVLNFEPGLALYVANTDPLIYYREILNFARQHLKNNGRLFFEINERYGSDVSALFSDAGFADVSIRQDLQDKDRMACGTWLINAPD